jgi:hypothetical protein
MSLFIFRDNFSRHPTASLDELEEIETSGFVPVSARHFYTGQSSNVMAYIPRIAG